MDIRRERKEGNSGHLPLNENRMYSMYVTMTKAAAL